MAGQFIIVPSISLDDPELLKSPATFMTLCVISTMTSANKNGRCFFKQETIAQRLNKSRQAISQSLNKLVDLGYLEIEHIFKGGRQGYSNYRLKYDVALAVQGELAPPQGELAPAATSPCTNKDNNLKDKNKKHARTREGFLRVIDKGFNAGDFKQWEHLTETEIMDAATACYDFHANRDGEYTGKDPVAGLRYWIRNGIKRGSVRKMVLQDRQADSPAKEYPNPEQVWQTNLKDRMQPAHWNAWIRPLWHDGDGKLCAPSQFIASEASKRHGDEIHSVLKGVEIIHQPYQQPQETMQNA